MNEGESTTQTFSESYTESGIDSNATSTNTILWSDTQKAATLTDEPISLKGAYYLLIKEVSTKGIVSYDVLTHTDDDAETTDPDYRNRYIATDSFYYQAVRHRYFSFRKTLSLYSHVAVLSSHFRGSLRTDIRTGLLHENICCRTADYIFLALVLPQTENTTVYTFQETELGPGLYLLSCKTNMILEL